MIEPPERAWLVRLYAAGDGWDQTVGQVEMIAVLRGDDVRIILR